MKFSFILLDWKARRYNMLGYQHGVLNARQLINLSISTYYRPNVSAPRYTKHQTRADGLGLPSGLIACYGHRGHKLGNCTTKILKLSAGLGSQLIDYIIPLINYFSHLVVWRI